MDWPRPELIGTARLRLEPLSVDHSAEMVAVLADPDIYAYIGGQAPTPEELRNRYALQVRGHSTDGLQGWLNWIVRTNESDAAIGYVQAGVESGQDGLVADLAWVISPDHQGLGYATEAAATMVTWLREHEVDDFVAFIHPEHEASIRVARHLGMEPTDVIEDGEVRWVS